VTVFLTTQYLEEADVLANRVGIIHRGHIVAEGTPDELKNEVGKPRMELILAEGDQGACMEVLGRFGAPLPPKDGKLMIEVAEGVAAIAPVVRALDEAGILVESLDVVEPTLDDVFVDKTGRHLEGAETGEPGTGETEVVAG